MSDSRWFKDAEMEPAKLRMMEAEFQSVFSPKSEESVRVLARILRDAYFFREAVSEEEKYLNNFAKKLLYNMGIWRQENQLEIVRALLGVAAVRSDEDGGRERTPRGNAERFHAESRWKER